MSEIDDISRFNRKESFANYSGLIPNLDESAERKIQGHISKHGPSMLRFILDSCAHTIVKYLVRFKKKYNSIVRRLGKSMAIVAIARILAETKYTMLSRRVRSEDEIDSLTEKKIRAMEERAKNLGMSKDIENRAKILGERGIREMSEKPFSKECSNCKMEQTIGGHLVIDITESGGILKFRISYLNREEIVIIRGGFIKKFSEMGKGRTFVVTDFF